MDIIGQRLLYYDIQDYKTLWKSCQIIIHFKDVSKTAFMAGMLHHMIFEHEYKHVRGTMIYFHEFKPFLADENASPILDGKSENWTSLTHVISISNYDLLQTKI